MAENNGVRWRDLVSTDGYESYQLDYAPPGNTTTYNAVLIRDGSREDTWRLHIFRCAPDAAVGVRVPELLSELVFKDVKEARSLVDKVMLEQVDKDLIRELAVITFFFVV